MNSWNEQLRLFKTYKWRKKNYPFGSVSWNHKMHYCHLICIILHPYHHRHPPPPPPLLLPPVPSRHLLHQDLHRTLHPRLPNQLFPTTSACLRLQSRHRYPSRIASSLHTECNPKPIPHAWTPSPFHTYLSHDGFNDLVIIPPLLRGHLHTVFRGLFQLDDLLCCSHLFVAGLLPYPLGQPIEACPSHFLSRSSLMVYLACLFFNFTGSIQYTFISFLHFAYPLALLLPLSLKVPWPFGP